MKRKNEEVDEKDKHDKKKGKEKNKYFAVFHLTKENELDGKLKKRKQIRVSRKEEGERG